MSSSTSSSRRLYRPAALCWLVGLVGLAEVGARMVPGSVLVSFPQHRSIEGNEDYTAVRLVIEELAPPEVLIIGSSRARESIVVPELRRRLELALGRTVEVRNYAVAGGEIDTTRALVELLDATGHIPRVLLYPLTPRTLRHHGSPSPYRFYFVNWRTLAGDVGRSGWPSESDLAEVLGQGIPLRLLRMRAVIRASIVQGSNPARFDAPRLNASLGGTTAWMRRDLSSENVPSLARDPVDVDQVKLYVNRLYPPGSQGVGEREATVLGELVDVAQRRGIRVLLIEIPTSQPLARAYPKGLVEDFREVVGRVAGATGAGWVSDSALRSQLGLEDYREQSHMNVNGALKYTAAIAPLVAELVASSASEGM